MTGSTAKRESLRDETRSLAATPKALAVVLVVGECPAILRVCQDAAPSEHYRWIHCASREEGERVLRRTPVSVVVACHQTTVGGGVSLLAHARELRPDSVGVLVTNQVDPELAEEAAQRGRVFRMLVRPFSDDDLRETVHAALDQAILNEQRGRGADNSPSGQTGDRGGTRGLLESLLPNLPTARISLDSSCRVADANSTAQLVLGQTFQKLKGQHANDVGVPCFGSPGQAPTAAHSLCGNRDLSRVPSWGQERAVLWSCRAVQDDHGEYGGCDVSFVDVTDRAELDVDIFLAKHEIEGIFDSITDPTFLVDEQFRVRRANRAFSFFADRSFAELLGEPCDGLLQQAGWARLEIGLKRVFRTGRKNEDELEVRGSRIFKVHLFPIVRAGRVRQVVVRYRDITEEKNVEERLLQAQKLASVGQLAAGIAHEINNPMGFISWNINQLADYLQEINALYQQTRALGARVQAGQVDAREAWQTSIEAWETSDLPFVLEDSRDIVAECNQGVDRVQRIVRDLRSYSHPSSVEWEDADLNQCVESAITIVRSQISRQCELVREFVDLPKVRCHPQRVIQVLINILVNAAHAVGESGRITLATGTDEGCAVIEVIDTGYGIPPEILPKVFDPFLTTKGVGEGTGLGLYLARRIVREHTGEIWIESEPGKGSRVTVTLPFDPGIESPLKGNDDTTA